MKGYRHLSEYEIKVLEAQGCRAACWDDVRVKDGFCPERVERVRFYGKVYLGVFAGVHEVEPGIVRPSGIREAELHEVTVGDDVLIERIGSYIARYDIGDRAYISDVGRVAATPGCAFGMGTPVQVLTESGRRFVTRLHAKLSAQEFALRKWLAEEAHLSVREAALGALNSLVEAEVDRWRGRRAVIGAGAVISRTREVVDTYVGAGARITGAGSLVRCSLLSTEQVCTRVTDGSICRDSVLAAGAEVLDGTQACHCFIGEQAHLGKGCSAEQSLFFANSYLDNGEACAVCAGPFTVSHHKSTLLIGGMFAFYNAGSGTNMSNHMYKAGPVHYGTLGRGCKTASGTHLVWPGTVGDFSMVMGKYDSHADLRDLPFAYVFNEKDGAHVVPAVNFLTFGTYRDTAKWPLRDARPVDQPRLDCIATYDALNPCSVEHAVAGHRYLEALLADSQDVETLFRRGGIVISRKDAVRGIELYRLIEELYIATHVNTLPEAGEGRADACPDWYDMLGLPVPTDHLADLACEVEKGSIPSIDALLEKFKEWNGLYRTWVAESITRRYTRDEVVGAVRRYEANLCRYYDALAADLDKECRLRRNLPEDECDNLREALHKDRTEALNKAKARTSFLLEANEVGG